jgi:signal transduction histidine kinase
MIVCLTQLQRAQQKWSSDPGRAKELLDDGVTAVQAALLGLRELAVGIHPPLLTHKGLAAAVRDLASRQLLPVTVDVPSERLPASYEASAYFFVSEALSNMVKHARASRGSVSIGIDGDRVTIEVADNGVGGARVTDEGTGLTGLADRMAALNGTLAITSNGGTGTRLSAEMPVPELSRR